MNSLARCATRNGWCSIPYTMPSAKCLAFCLFPLLARIAEWRNVPRQNHRNYASSESRDRKMLGNKNSFSCQSNLPFCGDKIQPKPYRGLPQACHGISMQEMHISMEERIFCLCFNNRWRRWLDGCYACQWFPSTYTYTYTLIRLTMLNIYY